MTENADDPNDIRNLSLDQIKQRMNETQDKIAAAAARGRTQDEPAEVEGEGSPSPADETPEEEPQSDGEGADGDSSDEGEPIPKARLDKALVAVKTAKVAREKAERELEETKRELDALRRAQGGSAVVDKALKRLAGDPTFKNAKGEFEIDQKVIKIASVIADELVTQRLGQAPDQMRKVVAESTLSRELGFSLTPDQAEIVARVRDTHHIKSARHAYALATLQHPSAFKEEDQRGANGQHFSPPTRRVGSSNPQRKQSASDRLRQRISEEGGQAEGGDSLAIAAMKETFESKMGRRA